MFGINAKKIAALSSLALILVALWQVDPLALYDKLGRTPWQVTLIVFALQVAVSLLAALRLWRLLVHFSIKASWKAALLASVGGQLAALVMIPLIGHVAGRQHVLETVGVSPSTNAALVGCERSATAAISVVAMLCSVGYFFRIIELIDGIPYLLIVLALLVGLILSKGLGATEFEDSLRHGIFRATTLLRVLETLLISLIGYIGMLVSYVIAFASVASGPDLAALVAAAAIVSFAASIPLSVGGWGLRELASIFVLKQLGVDAADALLMSVTVGALSTFSVIVLAPIVIRYTSGSGAPVLHVSSDRPPETRVLERAANWGFGVAVAALVFFQVHIPVFGLVTSINLADPFAMLALAALALDCLSLKVAPKWRVPKINRLLIVLSIVLTGGFVVGVVNVGVTQWALGGRLFGWLVLLGYVSAGYLMVATFGNDGYLRLTHILLGMAVAVVTVSVAEQLFAAASMPKSYSWKDLHGFAQNRNAFALQMLAVMVCVIGGLSEHFPQLGLSVRRRQDFLAAIVGVLLAGIALSGSRTGIATGAIVLFVSIVAGFIRLRFAIITIVSMLTVWVAAFLFVECVTSGTATSVSSAFSSPDSDHLRWKVNSLALSLWRDSILAGIGLGSFYARSGELLGEVMVIHSTPIWILTEFGLIGGALVTFSLFPIAGFLRRHWRDSGPNRTLFLVVLSGGLFAQLHEISFQRILWLVCGMLMAQPNSLRVSVESMADSR